MGKIEVEAFFTYLALDCKVTASTQSQSQAKAALLFLYQQVLDMELPRLSDLVKAKPRQHLSTVLTIAEVRAVLANLSGIPGLVSQLLYGSGLRVLDA
jgi:site-specific recombinase XerD